MTQTKESYSSKDPRYNLRPLATTIEDVLHIYGSHDGGRGGSEADNQLHPLCLPGKVWEARRHLMEVLVGVELWGGEGNVDTLPDSSHRRVFTVLH